MKSAFSHRHLLPAATLAALSALSVGIGGYASAGRPQATATAIAPPTIPQTPSAASETAPLDLQSPPITITFDLENYEWQNRILLVFAPSAADARYRQQMALWAEASAWEFDDRELIVVSVLADSGGFVDGDRLDPTAGENLRQIFGVATNQFRTILVGKDGWEKRRDLSPVSAFVVFEEIDAMPMRQQEMRERGYL